MAAPTSIEQLATLAKRLEAMNDLPEAQRLAGELAKVAQKLAADATARQAAEAIATKTRVAKADQADTAKARAYVLKMYAPGDVLDVDFGGGNVIKAQVQPDGSLVPFYGSPAAQALGKAMARTALGLDDSQRRTIVERV